MPRQGAPRLAAHHRCWKKSLPGASRLWPESFAPRTSGGFRCEKLQPASTAARPGFTTRSCERALAINPAISPVGALPGGKVEKPELDPAGKQQGCCAGLAENRAKSPARADGGSRKPATHVQRHRRHAAGLARERWWWPLSRDVPAGQGPWGRTVGEAPVILGAAERDGREQGEVRGFPENKAAAGSQRRRQRGGRVPRSRSSWGQGKAQKSTGSLCFISLATPAPSQAWLAGAARPEHAAVGDGEFGAGAAAAQIHGVTFGECHSRLTGWSGTQGRAGDSPCPGSTDCVVLL